MLNNTSKTQFEYPEGAIIAEGWQPIKPFDAVVAGNSNSYPVQCFPDVAQHAINEYVAYAKAPPAMAGTSCLSYIAIACQHIANVARDNYLIAPLSLNTLTIASSGERKTSCDSAFGKAIHEFEKEKTISQADDFTANKARRNILDAQKDKIIKQIKDKKSDDFDKLEYDLLELERKTPDAISAIFQMLYADTNQQSLICNLDLQHPSAGLFCDEAAIVVGGNGMNNDNAVQFFGCANTLWDGKPYKRNRITTPTVILRNKRLSTSLMMQPSVFNELTNVKDGQSRNTGFLARFLITRPDSTIGTRFYNEKCNMQNMDAFHARIAELLAIAIPYATEQDEKNRWINPPLLHLSKQAKDLWIDSYNQIEWASASKCAYGELQDFASKSADNAARIAANFHLFGGGNVNEPINATTMQNALQLASWYLEEVKLILQTVKAENKYAEAEIVLNWIKERQSNGMITSSTLLQNITPVKYRDKATLEPILKLLTKHHYLKPCESGKKQYLLHPDLCAI